MLRGAGAAEGAVGACTGSAFRLTRAAGISIAAASATGGAAIGKAATGAASGVAVASHVDESVKLIRGQVDFERVSFENS